MRTIGFLLVVIGAGIIYLGWNGKLGQAVSALLTGSSNNVNQESSISTSINKISSQTNSQNLPTNNGMNNSTWDPYGVKGSSKSTWDPYNVGG